MKYYVNENCIGCGLCVSTCPEVFSMTDQGVAESVKTEVPNDCLKEAADAAHGCPVGAIEEV